MFLEQSVEQTVIPKEKWEEWAKGQNLGGFMRSNCHGEAPIEEGDDVDYDPVVIPMVKSNGVWRAALLEE